MKRIIGTILLSALAFCIAGCGSVAPSVESSSVESSSSATSDQTTDTTVIETKSETTAATETEAGHDTLVVCFSATGTTMGIAEKIAVITDADLYEITPAVPYTDEDRNWTDSGSRCSVEQNDASVRPAIGSDQISLEGYSVIYIGYPIWFGQEPRIMDTFVESYDFDNITMIPFCTSGSSGIGQSGQNLATNAGSGNWLEGMRFAGDASDAEIEEWVQQNDNG